MHMDISQEQFYARIHSKNAAPQRPSPLTPAFNTYHENPSVWTEGFSNDQNGWFNVSDIENDPMTQPSLASDP
jgi:hypothetical protein